MAQRGPNQERSNDRMFRKVVGDEAYAREYGDADGMVDISQIQAGQMGFRTDLEGFVNNAAYVKRNMIAVLVEAPRGFQHLPHPQQWVRTLKALVELQAQSIEGMQSTLTAEFIENAVGGAGEMQEDISNMTRARSVPVFNWVEKYGKPINAFLTGWMQGIMQDPITGVPNVMTSNGPKPTDLLPDYTSMTVLFIEPDPTFTRPVHAWLTTNMMPKTAGEVTGRRDKTQAGEGVTYSVEFTGMTQEGFGVKAMAKRYLDQMNLSSVNPNLKPAFVDRIEADVTSAESGYQDQMDRASQIAVNATDPNVSGGIRDDYTSVPGDSNPQGATPNPGYTGERYRTNGRY